MKDFIVGLVLFGAVGGGWLFSVLYFNKPTPTTSPGVGWESHDRGGGLREHYHHTVSICLVSVNGAGVVQVPVDVCLTPLPKRP